ncbi:MAG: N-formylglutamate amidohydrolase, partial [Oligoflexus sp.]
LQAEWKHVVLFDAHSIRRSVPSIAPTPFPDMILGDRDGSSAAPALAQVVRQSLEASPYEVSYNQPFKGGQITRGFGQPDRGWHALQLEMSQDLYLQPGQPELDRQKCRILQPVLWKALDALDIAVRKLS